MAKRFLRLIAGGIVLAAGIALGQSPAAKVEFEVASIKQSPPIQAMMLSGKIHLGKNIDGARVDIGNMSLADLIPVAFKVKPYQISGPDWMSSNRFDIMGKMPEGAAKLKESVPEPEAQASANDGNDAKKDISISGPDGTQQRITQDGKGGMLVKGGPQGGTMRVAPGPDGSMRMEASKMTLVELADTLSRFVDRPVVDMTELKGTYQMALELSMADLMKAARAAGLGFSGAPLGGGAASPADVASDPSSGSIFLAVQQLGLKLEPRKTPVETIVIDHLEKTPTEN